ncbi:hypothetical protein REPUB_Repub18cG0173900 [Reevesia pubescens]
MLVVMDYSERTKVPSLAIFMLWIMPHRPSERLTPFVTGNELRLLNRSTSLLFHQLSSIVLTMLFVILLP